MTIEQKLLDGLQQSVETGRVSESLASLFKALLKEGWDYIRLYSVVVNSMQRAVRELRSEHHV